MTEKPEKELCREWREHPVTEYFIKALSEEVQELKDLWATGSFTAESAEGTAQINSLSLGKVMATELIIENMREVVGEDRDEYDH